jgi:hypothetical protein
LAEKPRGGGAHREAEVVAPKPAEWRSVRCPRRPRELAARAGRVAMLELG